MSTNQFRDSLAVDVMVGHDSANGRDNEFAAVADAVLRSPEMQQIRKALQITAAHEAVTHFPTHQAAELRKLGLSPHVIEWVLG